MKPEMPVLARVHLARHLLLGHSYLNALEQGLNLTSVPPAPQKCHGIENRSGENANANDDHGGIDLTSCHLVTGSNMASQTTRC